ncbi:MAG: hypothetical protein NTX25_01680 [Proteobacteria bacterium]|nr:hypothetical protein [Pseudomonadota bacterium]
MKKAREILSMIREMPGSKVLTLSVAMDEGASDFVFDVAESGRVGYHRDHRKQLLTLLDYGIQNTGGLIIRQFSKLSYEAPAKNGELMRFPYKLIYAIFLGHGHYSLLSKLETEDVCCTDSRNGRRMKREEGVIYRGWETPRAAAAQH